MTKQNSLLRSTANTRPVLPGSLRYIRSDVPWQVTTSEIEWLIEQNIRTIIDLRTDAEQESKPCRLAADDRFVYLHLPVTGGDTVPAAPDDVTDSYIRMVDEQMLRILAAIRNAPTNVLYFCNAGKDRTGVVSAILQKMFDVPEETIIADYIRSGENLAAQLEAFEKANPAVDPRVIRPQSAYMEQFLAWLNGHHAEAGIHAGRSGE